MLLFKQNKWTKTDIFTHIFRTILESHLDKGSRPLDSKAIDMQTAKVWDAVTLWGWKTLKEHMNLEEAISKPPPKQN